MTFEQKAFAIVEQYCNDSGWNGQQIPYNKIVEDFYIVICIDTVGKEPNLEAIISVVASRWMCDKRWMCKTPIPLSFSSIKEFGECVDAALRTIQKAYNQCLQAYQESPHTVHGFKINNTKMEK